MIVRALLVVGVAAALGLIAAAVLGYLLPAPTGSGAGAASAVANNPAMPRHVLLALGSTLLLLFSHCWIFLYLIATGRSIRQAVRDFGLEPELARESAGFKSAAFPWLLAAVGLALATLVFGGTALTGGAPAWVHHALFYVTLLAQAGALAVEKRVLDANERLMAGIDRRLGASPVATGPARAQGAG